MEESPIFFDKYFFPVIIPLITALIGWFAKQFYYRFFQLPKVLVHLGHFVQQPGIDYYFIKVICTTKPINITHIYIDEKSTNSTIHLDNENALLPVRLEPPDIYETWIKKDMIKDHEGVYKNVKVHLSTNRVLKSRKNKWVPDFGRIGGLVNARPDPDTQITQSSGYFED